jgi:hypothetical protein
LLCKSDARKRLLKFARRQLAPRGRVSRLTQFGWRFGGRLTYLRAGIRGARPVVRRVMLIKKRRCTALSIRATLGRERAKRRTMVAPLDSLGRPLQALSFFLCKLKRRAIFCNKSCNNMKVRCCPLARSLYRWLGSRLSAGACVTAPGGTAAAAPAPPRSVFRSDLSLAPQLRRVHVCSAAAAVPINHRDGSYQIFALPPWAA